MSLFNIIKLDAISSTNDYLKKKYKSSNCKDGDLIWAKEQTQGKGQRENRWLSQKGKSLTISIYKEFNEFKVSNSFILNAIVSLSIVKTLKIIGLKEVRIKWPNDIMSGNKKLGGILIENFLKSEFISSSIIGIGLNINEEKFEDLPNATSLYMEINQKFKLKKILNILIQELLKFFNLQEDKQNMIIDMYSSYLWKLNLASDFKQKNNLLKAKVKGINSSGNLILEMPDGSISAFNSNEIKMIY
ncbi:MAG: biotin--[acetyl-CoA-carboxylase] ligase [Flavobacteriaceae bacterium]|nr:biotin--[acetyl-CoA-carboxylase] ligase [Flavobacteriaceae bacterium]